MGITCNAICPGYVYTPLVEAQIDGQAKAHGIPREQVIREVLLGAAAQQALRHHRRARRHCRVPRLGRRRIHHRHLDCGGRRLDRALTSGKEPGGAAMTATNKLTPLEAVNKIRNDRNGQVVLVLQGGGALGAYQGGVYQALHEAGIEPDWIIGTSIGAINAAIITGNRPEDRLSRLQEFWRRVETRDLLGRLSRLDRRRRRAVVLDDADQRHLRVLRASHPRLPRRACIARRRPGRLLLDRAPAQDAGGTRRFLTDQPGSSAG